MVFPSRVVRREAILMGSTVEKPTGLTTLYFTAPVASGTHDSSHVNLSLCACMPNEKRAKAIAMKFFLVCFIICSLLVLFFILFDLRKGKK